MPVVTRFPPSPTGYFHIGSARTALFNYLFTAHEKGTMYLRFEDTDKERSSREYERDILEGLTWLEIPYELPALYRQSERISIYQTYVKTLLDRNLAYEAEESKAGSGKKVIRFRNPNTKITFRDLVRGDVSFETTELGDLVIGRSIDEPLYHLAVVVDDHEMGVTHVIRGEDHISNTPRQIMILEALGFPRPLFAHIPLILAPDRSKLSKRHGAVSVTEYRSEGYLPHALRTYLSFLGWTFPSGNEFPTLQEIIDAFDITQIHKSSAIFDHDKLRWYNRQYLLRLDPETFGAEVYRVLEESIAVRNLPWNRNIAQKLLPLIRERVSVRSDVKKAAAEGEYDFFFIDPSPDAAKIPEKGSNAAVAARHLAEISRLMRAIPKGEWSTERLKDTVWDFATAAGRGTVLWPLRFALSGRERSPDPFTIAAIIGMEATLRRIDAARALLDSTI